MKLTLTAECWITFYKWLAKVICLYNYCNVLSPFLWIGTIIDSFHSSGSFSFFQIEVINLWISKQIVLPLALISSAGIWSIPGDLWLFSLLIASSTSAALGSSIYWTRKVYVISKENFKKKPTATGTITNT